ncbi:S8 family serine peptidase [Halobellus sp. H-GB7]|uniref:S8 family serine peptidase n=1 Tax=Halobellus sp. H-GB7 TaxID=3069756 RepID=UPI0027B86485|nr:S8 family serine peptidase [Halobellus sp. H-GB7]MDQ2054193.1 S8 family serine peptidase [Halobellus sp. H-GB7]
MDRKKLLVLATVTVLIVAGAVPAVGAGGATNTAASDSSSLSTPGIGTPTDQSATASDDDANATPPEVKIESGLLDDQTATSSSGPSLTTDAQSGEMVDVVVEAAAGNGDAVADRVRGNAGAVALRHGNLVQARLPRSALTAVANTPAVERIRRPNRPTTATVDRGSVVSEGLATMNTSGAYTAGHYGDNVTVAVVDMEFNATNPEISDNVADVYNPGGDFTNTSDAHGTAVSEVVVDTAPNVSLVLIDVESGVDLLDAMDYIREDTSVDVAVMSLSWYNVGPLDGSGAFNEEFEQSAANGTVWSVSSGNAANGNHWHGSWQDGDGDDWLNFTSDRELLTVESSGSGSVWLQWDDWKQSDQNYDLYLYDSKSDYPDNPAVVSNNVQNMTYTGEPTEAIGLGTGATGTYYLAIKRENAATKPVTFTLFSGDKQSLTPSTAARSVTNPTTDAVLTVGATRYDTDEVEAFSSRGPTLDGRIKPDIVAPDGVSTDAYEPDRFFGTSASAPHAGGVIALMADKNDSLSPSETVSVLETTANESAVPGTEPDNGAGSGLVDAAAAVGSVSYSETTPPSLTNTAAVDATDSDGVVVEGDTVTVNATVTDDDSGVKNVTANVSAFGAGTIALTDSDGDAKYNATFTVDAPPDAYGAEYTVPITAYDVAENNDTVQTNTLQLTDAEPPSITDATAVDLSDGDGAVTALESVTINATATDAESGVDRVTADASAFGAGTVTLTDADGDAVYNATVAVDADETSPNGSYAIPITAVDYAGNSNATDTNELQLNVSDRTAPSISGFSVRVIDTRTLYTTFSASETLSDVEVRITDVATGTTVQMLTEADFGSEDGFYSNVTGLKEVGRYRATLVAANDSAGNNGASGQSASVQFVVEDVTVEHLSGPEPDSANLTSRVYLTQGPDGLLQMQLRDKSGSDLVNRTDLSDIGVASDTRLAINVTVTDWTPRLLLGAGRNATWDTTALDANTTAINVTTAPADVQYNQSQLDGTNDPWSETDRADVSANASVDMAVSDLGSFDPGRRDRFAGAMLTTDAQSFGAPEYDETTGGLRLYVAAPHYNVDGGQNQGFFTAFLPTAVLDDWGVSDPANIEVSAIGTTAEPASSTVTAEGIRLEVPIHYSAGDVEVAPDATPPAVRNPTISDQTDGDGTVADGDRVRVAATVTDGGSVASVEADASAFGGGTIDLRDADADDTYTGNFTVDGAAIGSGDSYAVAVTATDAVGNAKTASTNALSVPGSGDSGSSGGSSGGSGGGGGAPAPAPAPTPTPTPTPKTTSNLTETDGGAELSVRNAKSGETVGAAFGNRTRSDVGTVTEVRITPASDTESLRISVTPPTRTTGEAPELTDGDPVGYFHADATGVSDDQISNATLRVSVSNASLPAGTAPEQVRLYRHHDGAWQRLNTTHIGNGTYEAETPGFSVFAIGTEPRDGSGVSAAEESTNTPTVTPAASSAVGPAETTRSPSTSVATTAPTSTEQSAPGFGPAAGVVAVVAAALLARRHR